MSVSSALLDSVRNDFKYPSAQPSTQLPEQQPIETTSRRGPAPAIVNAQAQALAAAAPKPLLSPVRVLPNGIVMLSGTLPFIAPGVLKQGTIEELTAQIFTNIKTELAKVSLTLADVVDVIILMTDLKNDYAAMNSAYVKEFADVATMPTRMAYGVAELPFGANIEIKCTAYKAPT